MKNKKGKNKTKEIGRSYAISRKQVPGRISRNLTEKDKRLITKAVRKTVRDFGEAIKLLGRE